MNNTIILILYYPIPIGIIFKVFLISNRLTILDETSPYPFVEKRGWGHSSWEQAIEVAKQAGVKKLALFHHDPEHDDTFLTHMEVECQKHFSDVFLAREGAEIIL
jgi:ribonuclease BN (tRNA processing enzyme)